MADVESRVAALEALLAGGSSLDSFQKNYSVITDALEGEGLASPSSIRAGVDMLFIVLCGVLVFFMQCGFIMLSVGAVRRKNAKNIILYILLDATFGAVAWFFFGWAFAYGPNPNASSKFIGAGWFVTYNLPKEEYVNWFFQYTFAATATTIISGSIIERTKVVAYIIYAMLVTGFVYPVVAHWVWSCDGWLSACLDSPLLEIGLVDLAGCGVVHMVGGIGGAVGAAIVGPRIGRYDASGRALAMPGHSAPFLALGVFILWFGWYGFNTGSLLGIVGQETMVPHVAIVTTLGAAGGTLGCLSYSLLVEKHWNVVNALNGALAGLVSITAACASVELWAGLVIGYIGGWIFSGCSWLLTYVKIDDPLEAAAMHGGCGMWGLWAVGWFASPSLMGNDRACGVFYGGCGGWLLGVQTIGIVVIAAWVIALMAVIFGALHLIGILRVAPDEEKAGMDSSYHGGDAYPKDQQADSEPFTTTTLDVKHSALLSASGELALARGLPSDVPCCSVHSDLAVVDEKRTRISSRHGIVGILVLGLLTNLKSLTGTSASRRRTSSMEDSSR